MSNLSGTTENNNERVMQMKTVQKEALDTFIRKNNDYGDAFATYGHR